MASQTYACWYDTGSTGGTTTDTPPSASIDTTRYLSSAMQVANLSCSDDKGLVGYYW